MKITYDKTFAQITDEYNIRSAIHSAAIGKHDKKSVQYALDHEDETVEEVMDILLNKKRFLPDVRIGREINDGIRAKKRIIVTPSFTEQIIAHALIQVIGPHFQHKFYNWSCGSIPGRGQESMSKYIFRKLQSHPKECKYYAVLDVGKCFDSLDANAVGDKISEVEKDEDTMWLIRQFLSANKVQLPDGSIREGGVPIGTYTSPWFANIAMDRSDHAIKDDSGIYALVRFMDDMFLIDGNRRRLRRAIEASEFYLSKFGLKWKNPPEIHLWERGDAGKVRFCGVQFTRESFEIRDEVFLRARRTVNRICRKQHQNKRITVYDAKRLVTYAGRFRGFGKLHAFTTGVLRGKIKYSEMRKKISDQYRRKSRTKSRTRKH